MAELIILGTAASVPDAEHDTVGLALHGPGWAVPIDCGGSPLHKLARFGVELGDIEAVVLTHSHADHIYGLPILVQGLWLGGREVPLTIHGPEETLGVARRALELYTLAGREGMFSIDWRPVSRREGVAVLELGEILITATPVAHRKRDTRAYRFEDTDSGRSIVYSADTEPCPTLIRLAEGADILIHEATGDSAGHSSPAQAAKVAREAGVGQLVLIHYPVHGVNLEAWRLSAAGFSGPVHLAQDGDVYAL
jgi:ribonuclease Z